MNRKWTIGLRNSVFRKHLFLFSTMIFITATLFLFVYLHNASKDIVGKIKSESSERLDRAARNLDIMLENIDRTAFQFSLALPTAFVLNSPFDATTYDLYQVRAQMQSWAISSPLIHSFYLHVYQNNKVLTTSEGYYDLKDFYERAFLDEMRQLTSDSNYSWTELRTQKRVGASNSDLITITKAVPVTHKAPLGMLVINLNQASFLRTLSGYSNIEAEPLLMLDPSGQLVAEATQHISTEKLIKGLNPGEFQTNIVRDGDNRYFITARQFRENGWTVIQVKPYKEYSSQMALVVKKASIIYSAFLIVGLCISYLFASILYGPWKHLRNRLQSFVMKDTDSAARDDYKDVDSAIGHLITMVRHNEPIVRGNLVRDLVHNHISEEWTALERFAELGVNFVHPNYSVVVIAGERPERGEEGESKNNLLLFSLAEEVLQSAFQSAGAILERNKFVFILNLQNDEFDEADMAKLEQCCNEIIHQTKHRMHIPISICIGGVRPIHRVHEAYEQAQRTMAYKAFRMHADILFADDMSQPIQFEYPASYQKRLLNAILLCDREKADTLVSELFERYIYCGGYSQPKLHQLITMLISYILSTLAQEGYDIGPVIDGEDLPNLQKCNNSYELRSSVGSSIMAIIAYLESFRGEKRLDARLQNAIMYMEQNYDSNISISDIADAVEVSSGHLSRLFKSELSKSPLEYLTQYRLEKGKQLLGDPSLSLSQISIAIGYIDAHSFIRLFKKHEGMTPGEYRRIGM